MRFLLLSIGMLFFAGCNNHHTDPYKNNLNVPEKYVAAIDTAHFTIIHWTDTLINIGTMKEGDTVFAKFKFNNTGKTPLFVLSIQPSCGCTIVNYPHGIIYQGETQAINAKFSTEHMHGFIRKTILVTTNTSNHNKTLLSIEANVLGRYNKRNL